MCTGTAGPNGPSPKMRMSLNLSVFIHTRSVRSSCFLFLLFRFAHSRRRSGKVGISRVGRDFQGRVGAGGNLILVFAGFQAPAFSTALLRLSCPATRAPVGYEVRAVSHGDLSVQMFMHCNGAARQAITRSEERRVGKE